MKRLQLAFQIILLSVSFSSYGQELSNFMELEYPSPENDVCLSQKERQQIQEELTDNVRLLTAKGILKPTLQTRARVSFGWPLAASPELDWSSYYGVSAYVDQQPGQGVRDFNCSFTTYDTHRGTDYFTYPFPWYLYKKNLVHVVAAARGTIVGKTDGNYDQNCKWEGAGSWNAIYIQHDDGSTAWYGHLKTGRLTEKEIGDQVEKGEFLGVVGSSGRSSAPHLHFEVYDMRYRLIDPYQGACNSMNDDSWWDEQADHLDSYLNAVLTHSAPPQFGCPLSDENPNLKGAFAPGEQVYMGAYLRDQRTGQQLHWTIEQPNGRTWKNWTQWLSGNRLNGSTYWNWNLPQNGPYGTWKIIVQYLDQTVERTFEYGSIVSSTVQPANDIGLEIFPNPTRNQIQLRGLQKKAKLTLYNVYGEIVIQQAIGPETQYIDLSNIAPGVHFAKIALDGKYYQQKIIVL